MNDENFHREYFFKKYLFWKKNATKKYVKIKESI